MKQYSSGDFNDNEAWLVFRLDTQVQHQPIDIYMIMDLSSGAILCHDLIENTISQKDVDHLLQQAKSQNGNFPRCIFLAYGDPAEPFIDKLSKKLKINFESVPAHYLEELVAPVKKSFGEQFFSPSSIGYIDTQNEEVSEESIRLMIPDSYDLCPCASGKKYKFCCKKIFREITEAMVAAEEGNLIDALKWIDQARSIVGETSEVLCREAIVYSFFDRNKSNNILAECLKLHPQHPRAHYLRAITFKENGDLVNAIKSYEIAIANYPASDHFHLNETYNNLGTAFYEIGEHSKAKIAWEKALLYMPSDKMARRNLEEFIYKHK